MPAFHQLFLTSSKAQVDPASCVDSGPVGGDDDGYCSDSFAVPGGSTHCESPDRSVQPVNDNLSCIPLTPTRDFGAPEQQQVRNRRFFVSLARLS
jgi:hypothetical protein